MKKLSLEESKKMQLDILDFVTDVCEKNKIRYWLEFGTLIGAVRHKGYIPWDDDIDIGMLREDYVKFREIFNDPSKRYELHDIENDKDYNFLFAKIFDTKTVEKDPNAMKETCLNIDLFIFDDVPDSERLQRKIFDRRDLFRKLNNIQVLGMNKSSFVKTFMTHLIKPFFMLLPSNYFLRKFYKEMQRYGKNEKFAANLCGYARYVVNKSDVSETILTQFENRQYRIPVGFDRMLTSCFGDYMTLPPVEKRCLPHSCIEIFVKD